MNKSSLISLMQAYYPSCIPLIKSGLPQTDDVAVCEVGRLLQKYLPTSGESQVFNVYRLLDFSKKGYITLEDIEEFLCQLSQAETDDVEQIRECLCQIVQGMVPMKQQDLFDYWSLYCMYLFFLLLGNNVMSSKASVNSCNSMNSKLKMRKYENQLISDFL